MLDRFLDAASRAADVAAAAIAGQADVGEVATKADGSPSLVADTLAEEAALAHLVELGLPVISEEGFGEGTEPRGGDMWIALDPIDGTGNFRAGLAPYAFSAGLVQDGVAVAGVVLEHVSGRRWSGARGLGAWRDGNLPISTRPGGGTLMVPSPNPGEPAVVPPGFRRLRITGCTSVDLCCVADGSAAAWHDLDRGGTHTHDVAGALGVLAGTGAAVLGPDGGPLRLLADTHALIKFVAAADEERARELVSAFSQCR